MEAWYEFKRAITVDGKPFTEHQQVPQSAIPVACFSSLLRLKDIFEVQPPASAAAPATDEPKKKSK